MNIKQKFMDYCKNSTIHGMYYVYRSRNWFDRTFWIIAMLFCSIMAANLCQQLWIAYSSDPLITAVQNAYYPVKRIHFPSVLVCSDNLKRFDTPWAEEAKKSIKAYGFSDEIIKEFFDSLTNYTANPAHFEEVVSIHQMLYSAGIFTSFYDILEKVKGSCSSLLLQCIWRSTIYNCSEMFYSVLTRSGFCCRFDEDYFSKNTPEGTSFHILNYGEKSLKLVLNGEYNTQDGEAVDSKTRMYIVGRNEQIPILDLATYLAPQFSYDIAVNVHEIIASEYVKQLPRYIRKCTLPEQDHVASYKNCVASALLDFLIQKCKCFPVFKYPGEIKYPYQNCTWDQYQCLVVYAREYRSSQLEENSYNICQRQCEEVVYSPHIRYTKWSRNRKPAYNTSTNYDSDGRYLKVTVRYDSTTCFRYIRQVIFTWDQMLANLGGTFGLSIGGSIISAIEIVWLSADIIVSYLRDTLRKKPVKDTDQKNVKSANAWDDNELPEIGNIPFAH